MDKQKPVERAVALQYKSEDQLPELVAKGIGDIARRIEAIALEHNIPVQRDAGALQVLSRLNIGQSISDESFPAIAEIIAYIYHVDAKWREQHEFLAPILSDDQ